MALSDKMGNKADQVAGKVKEKAGEQSDNEELRDEGRTDQAKADLSEAGEKVKDAFKR